MSGGFDLMVLCNAGFSKSKVLAGAELVAAYQIYDAGLWSNLSTRKESNVWVVVQTVSTVACPLLYQSSYPSMKTASYFLSTNKSICN